MAILIDEHTNVLVQGITGNEGSRCTKFMIDYGTKIVCGVTPGKSGQDVDGIPVYNTIKEALQKHPEINASVIFVPPRFAKSAMLEAIENKIPLITVITENIPLHDTAYCLTKAKENKVRIVGPSSIGIISSGKCKLGAIGGGTNKAYVPGNIGIISKSGGMSNETAYIFKLAGLGQSTVIGIGGDVLNGFSFKDALDMFEKVQGKRIGRWLGNHLAPDLRIKSRKEGGYVLVFGKKALEKPQITDGDLESIYDHLRNFNEYQKEDSRREDEAKPAYR